MANISRDTLENIINALEGDCGTHAEIALHLEVSQAHIHNFVSGKRNASPTLIRALRKHGYLARRKQKIRTEITWYSQEQKDAMQSLAEFHGHKTIQDYCRWRADCELEAQSLDAAARICSVCGGDLFFDIEQDELELDSSPCTCKEVDNVGID